MPVNDLHLLGYWVIRVAIGDGCSMAGQTINVSHYVTDHGGTYILVWRDDQTDLVARHCCQWADDRQLDFTWRDAAAIVDYADELAGSHQKKWTIKQWLKKLLT